MQIVPALCSGATIRLFAGFEPGRFLADMKADRVTHTFMVPTMINMIAANKMKPTAQPLVVWSARPADGYSTASAQSSAAPFIQCASCCSHHWVRLASAHGRRR